MSGINKERKDKLWDVIARLKEGCANILFNYRIWYAYFWSDRNSNNVIVVWIWNGIDNI